MLVGELEPSISIPDNIISLPIVSDSISILVSIVLIVFILVVNGDVHVEFTLELYPTDPMELVLVTLRLLLLPECFNSINSSSSYTWKYRITHSTMSIRQICVICIIA